MLRRGFLEAILATATAPAIARAASLMKVRALPSGLLVPDVAIWTEVGYKSLYVGAHWPKAPNVFPTVQEAIKHAAKGCTIYVATYSGDFHVTSDCLLS